MANSALERAIDAVGGPTQASFICRMSVGAIYKWRRAGVVTDSQAAWRLAQASGVPIEELIGLKSTATSCDDPSRGDGLASPLAPAAACA